MTWRVGEVVRVLVVDDVLPTRRFLRAALERSGRFTVVAEAANPSGAVHWATECAPDLVLLDVSMPEGGGAEALPGLLAAAPHAVVVVLSGQHEVKALPLVRAGAAAFVQKGAEPEELVERLLEIMRSAEASAGATVAPPSGRRPTAVVCDDDAVARRMVGAALERCAVEVLAEVDVVPDVVALAGMATPDLVVLDLWLEGTTGTSALPELRAASPDTAVVVYSGHDEWRHEALARGAAAFVVKPHVDDLADAVCDLLGLRPADGR